MAALEAVVPFVAPEELERARGRPFVLRLGANESPQGPSPRVLDALRAGLGSVAWYGDPASHDLRAALSDRLGVSREEILVGSGIDDLLGLAVRCVLDPGDAAVTTAGTYPTFAYHVAAHGARAEPVAYGPDFRVDRAALADAARASGARLVYVSNPDNPTGTVHDEAALAELLSMLPSDCALVLDEAYREYGPTPDVVDRAGWRRSPRLLSLRTFSKAYGLAGLRVGYALADARHIENFNKVRLHFGVNRLAQVAALAALGDEGHVRACVRETAAARASCAAAGASAGWHPLPSATNFVAFDTESDAAAASAVEALARAGAFVRRGTLGRAGRLVRVTVGSDADHAVLAGMLARSVVAS